MFTEIKSCYEGVKKGAVVFLRRNEKGLLSEEKQKQSLFGKTLKQLLWGENSIVVCGDIRFRHYLTRPEYSGEIRTRENWRKIKNNSCLQKNCTGENKKRSLS